MRQEALVSFLRIAGRNLLRHRVRTVMTLAAIAFGVAALVLTGGFIEDVMLQLREATIKSQHGHIQVSRAGYSLRGRQDLFGYLIEDTREVDAVLAGDAHVSGTASRLYFQGLLNNGYTDMPVVVEGVTVDDKHGSGGHVALISGSQMSGGSDLDALIGEGVANSMRLAEGGVFTLVANGPGGALNTLDFQVKGVFRTFSKDFDDRTVRIPVIAAQELLIAKGVHSIVVSLRDTATTDVVSARLRNKLTDRGYEVRTWLELDDFYPKAVALYKRQFGVLQFIVLVIVMLSVANSVNMTVFERRGEYGTIRALGGRQTDIVQTIIFENLVVGTLGSVLGLIIAGLVGTLISTIGIPMPPPPNANGGYIARIQFVPSTLVLAVSIGVVATTASAVIAAGRVAKIPIAAALRQNI